MQTYYDCPSKSDLINCEISLCWQIQNRLWPPTVDGRTNMQFHYQELCCHMSSSNNRVWKIATEKRRKALTKRGLHKKPYPTNKLTSSLTMQSTYAWILIHVHCFHPLDKPATLCAWLKSMQGKSVNPTLDAILKNFLTNLTNGETPAKRICFLQCAYTYVMMYTKLLEFVLWQAPRFGFRGGKIPEDIRCMEVLRTVQLYRVFPGQQHQPKQWTTMVLCPTSIYMSQRQYSFKITVSDQIKLSCLDVQNYMKSNVWFLGLFKNAASWAPTLHSLAVSL